MSDCGHKFGGEDWYCTRPNGHRGPCCLYPMLHRLPRFQIGPATPWDASRYPSFGLIVGVVVFAAGCLVGYLAGRY